MFQSYIALIRQSEGWWIGWILEVRGVICQAGKVTVLGKMGTDVHPRTLNYIFKQASLEKGDFN